MIPQTIYKPIYDVGERVVRSNARADAFRFRGVIEEIIGPLELAQYLKRIKINSESGLHQLGCTFAQFIKWLKERDKDAYRNYWYLVKDSSDDKLYICIESDLLPDWNL